MSKDSFLKVALVATIFLFMMLMCGRSQAQDFDHALKVEDASVDLFKIGFYRNPYYAPYDEQLTQGANLNLNLSALRYVFWNGQFQMLGDSSRLHEAGLTFMSGLHLGPWFDAYYFHNSQHLLDNPPLESNYHFPQSDFYGLRIHFFRKEGVHSQTPNF
jgi:hypothetical protein